MTNTHVILVAFEVRGETRENAEERLLQLLPRPLPDGPHVECWWVAEDDRRDGSDNDSAVFVSPGNQGDASKLLYAARMNGGKHNIIHHRSPGNFRPVRSDA